MQIEQKLFGKVNEKDSTSSFELPKTGLDRWRASISDINDFYYAATWYMHECIEFSLY